MNRSTKMLIVLAVLVSILAVVPACAVTWVQVGTAAGPFTTPGFEISPPLFSTAFGTMPAELAVAGGVVPNMKVTYHHYVHTYWDPGSFGFGGLVLYCDPSNTGVGLFTGINGRLSGSWYSSPCAANSPIPSNTPDGAPLGDADVVVEIIGTQVSVTTSTGTSTYTITPADASNWASNMKFAAFRGLATPGDPQGYLANYATTTVSSITFYKDADQVMPKGTIEGTVTLNGSGVGAGATVTTTDGAFTTVTDSAGHYSFILSPGSYTLRASKNGFVPQEQGPISLADAQTVTQNFDLTGPNWVQAAPTIETTYATPDAQASAPMFSAVGQMPITLGIAGGVVPNLKVTYTLSLAGIWGWGDQFNGNSGLALFVPSTPTTTTGLFTGVSHPTYGSSAGAIVGNNSQIPYPTASFTPASTYNVTVEVVNGTAWTTLQNVNTGEYTATSTDIANWTGNLGFAAFKSDPGVNWAYGRTFVSNITFYRDANQVPANAGFINGHVTAANLPGNPPVGCAEVSVMGEDITVNTNSAGYYEMTVPIGDYTVRTQASGYDTQEPTVHISAGQTLVHDVSLTHSGTWELSSDYNTSLNPNGQWTYGYTTDLNAPLLPWSKYTRFDAAVGNMDVWTKDPGGTTPNAWYGWLTKNSTGGPIAWNNNDLPYGYVENNQMSFGGGGGWWMSVPPEIGAVYPRIRWTSPDRRMIKIYFKIAGQSPTSRVGYLTLAKNNAPSAVKSIEGFVGRIANGKTDAVGPSPEATFETQLLVTTGDTIDLIQGRHAPEMGVAGAWSGCFGWPYSSMAIWATISPGNALICSTWDQLKSKVIGDTVYMETPVQVASTTSGAGSFDKKFGSPATLENVFYIQNADRTQGFKCISDGTLTPYDSKYKIVFTGKIEADPLYPTDPTKKVIRILSISSAVEGTEPGPLGKGSKALTNTGTLVKVWGKVVSKAVNPNAWSDLWDSDPTPEGTNMVPKYDYEYITINDGAGDIKIMMHVQASYMSNVDAVIGGISVGDYIGVTGIASTTTGSDVVVAPRSMSDILEYVP